jgi:hypothetical protein
MKKYHRLCCFLFLFVFSALCMTSYPQEKKDTLTRIGPRIAFTYLSTSDDTIVLTANIFVKRDEGSFALKNAVIDFSAAGEKETWSLGRVVADEEGNAVLKFSVKAGLPADKSGMTNYTAQFASKGTYSETSERLTAKLAKLSVRFSKEDSLRVIHITARELVSNGEMKPLVKEKVQVYVLRMLSMLKVGEIDLDDSGTGKLECPEQLVGDSLGNLVFVAKIEESDIFGNVSGQSSISWGIPKQYYLAEKPTRELWTPIAPIWMIITLIIMLTGVWAHYLYAVIQLFWIKVISRKE